MSTPSGVVWAPADPAAGGVWARSAALAALQVPAEGWEADAWGVRGLADVALGCALLDSRDAYAELDTIVRASGITVGGPAAMRLRRLRALGGTVPSRYPKATPLPRVRAVRESARLAAELISEFCVAVASVTDTPRGTRARVACPEDSHSQLRWGERYRPSPVNADVIVVQPELPQGSVWRGWLRLPWSGEVATVIVERPPRTPAVQRLIWRGIHDGAHLDHIETLTRFTRSAPSPAEFGAGLAVAEAYAMAVEITATVGCLLDGTAAMTRVLVDGLIERIGRLPQSVNRITTSHPHAETEFTALPTLAEAYVVEPLRLLGGAAPGPLLPAELTHALVRRWTALCGAFPAAARLTAAAHALG